MASGMNSVAANDLLLLLFNATTWANVAINATSSPITNLYISLHTANPAGGNQTTSEAAYTSYARVAVVRTSSGWTVTSNEVVNEGTVTFPAATGGSETETYFGIGTLTSGSGVLMYYGQLTSSLAVSNGITPQAGASALTVTH